MHEIESAREQDRLDASRRLSVKASFTKQALRLTNHRVTPVTDVRFTVDGKQPTESFYFMAGQPERVSRLDSGESHEFVLGAIEYIPPAPLVLVSWTDENGKQGAWSQNVQRPVT